MENEPGLTAVKGEERIRDIIGPLNRDIMLTLNCTLDGMDFTCVLKPDKSLEHVLKNIGHERRLLVFKVRNLTNLSLSLSISLTHTLSLTLSLLN